MKKLLLISTVILLIKFICAANLGISPSELHFSQPAGKETCQNITLFSNANQTLISNILWSSSQKKELKYYTLSSEQFGISIKSPQDLQITGKTETQICLTAKNSGQYSGALFYQSKTAPAAVGIWISANITKPKQEPTTTLSTSRFKSIITLTSLSITLFLFSSLIALLIMQKRML